jgi:hypothetical protein
MRQVQVMLVVSAVALASGCSDSESTAPPAVPQLSEVQRIVTIGDGTMLLPDGASSTTLLLHNDDDAFPEFAGRDLATVLPQADVVRTERDGYGYRQMDLGGLPCVCGADSCAANDCIDATDGRPTLLVVQLGVDDLEALVYALLGDPELRADVQPAVDELAASVQRALGFARDPALFPTPPLLCVTNAYDPTDGVGDIAQLLQAAGLAGPQAEEITPELLLTAIDGFDAAIETEARARGARFVDLRSAFHGHALHFRDNPSEDQSLWLEAYVNPNRRGAHEIRRALWLALTGESVDGVPDLPWENPPGIPPMPSDGWADAITDASVPTHSEIDGEMIENLTPNPELALGPPNGILDAVSLGTTGSFVVVDLGAGEEAYDGEGDDVVVVEIGSASGGTPEPYGVSVADAPEGPFVHLADAEGEASFDLGPTGLARARYVRVESLLPADELPFTGSPSFPGPEIDAIGAVHPGAP